MSPLDKSALSHGGMARAVVFDLDGTLVDSVPDIHAAVAAFLAERGHAPLDLATVTGFVGNGVPALVERVLLKVEEPANPLALSDAVARFGELYGASPAALSSLYPGVEEALRALRSAGFALGVCTNKPEGPARQVLDTLGIAGYFAAVTGGDSLPQRKPDPAPLHHTAVQLQVEMEDLVYVGDSEVDAATAAAAAVRFVLFTEGYRKSPIEEIAHDAAVKDFTALPGLLMPA